MAMWDMAQSLMTKKRQPLRAGGTPLSTQTGKWNSQRRHPLNMTAHATR